MNDRGQALIEYTLIAVSLVLGLFITKALVGPYWPFFLSQLGLYSEYNGAFDAILSAPFP